MPMPRFVQSFLFPLFLLLMNLVTKYLFLTAQDIGHDEPFSVYHAQFDLAVIPEQLKGYNNPPLYELLLHVWIRCFGLSPLSLRLLPLLFACLAPLGLFYFGKRFFSLRAGVISSLLLSCSSLLLYYSHDCRVYSLFLLLSILSMHFFMALLPDARRKTRTVLLFVLTTCLLVYAHYFGIFILGLQCLHLLAFYRKTLLRFAGYYLMVAVLYLPQLYVLVSRMGYSVRNGTWLDSPAGIESLYNMLWAFSNAPVVTVACVALLLAGLIRGIKHVPSVTRHKNPVLILAWFLLPFFGMFFISFWVPMYISRYLIFVLPAYYILLALCLEKIFPKTGVQNIAAVVLVLCFAFGLKLDPDKKQHMAEAVKLAKRFKGPGTLVAVFPKDALPAFAYHYNRDYFSSVSDGREYHLTDSLLRHDGVYLLDTGEALADSPVKANQRLICIFTEQGFNSLQADLEKKYPLIFTERFGNNYSFCVFDVTDQ